MTFEYEKQYCWQLEGWRRGSAAARHWVVKPCCVSAGSWWRGAPSSYGGPIWKGSWLGDDESISTSHSWSTRLAVLEGNLWAKGPERRRERQKVCLKQQLNTICTWGQGEQFRNSISLNVHPAQFMSANQTDAEFVCWESPLSVHVHAQMSNWSQHLILRNCTNYEPIAMIRQPFLSW